MPTQFDAPEIEWKLNLSKFRYVLSGVNLQFTLKSPDAVAPGAHICIHTNRRAAHITHLLDNGVTAECITYFISVRPSSTYILCILVLKCTRSTMI